MSNQTKVSSATEKQSIFLLQQRIQELRQRMQAAFVERGGIDEVVLTLSMELDGVLNEYQRMRLVGKSAMKQL